MFVPVSWLNDYVDVKDIDIKEYCDRMIMSGSNIEEVNEMGNHIENVVVGKILKIEKHPDADKLVVTQIDIGTEEIQIVTGASNINEGDYVPVVKVGGKLPGGIKIKKGKLRGIESYGMLCSAGELGIPENVAPIANKDGIFILDQAYTLGADIVEVLALKEQIVEFEITPNRPDCLSMIGMARETATTFDLELKYPSTVLSAEQGDVNEMVSVEIKTPELCNRYIARVIKDVKIKQSPWWLQKKLIASGVRPINNIVDITNYVMLEYGQPLHAFDISTIAGNKIIVDTAQAGQKFKTLDGVERTLDENILMINDEQKALALAGVMGGENSEVKDDTTTILLESASFNANNVRLTSKKLGFRTEASSRFEKGIDANLCITAADRVCRLVEELEIGTVLKGAVDVYPVKQEAKEVVVRTEKMNQLLGTTLLIEEMKTILENLEMEIKIDGKNIIAKVPTFRRDVVEEIDFLEEIARIYGYNNLGTTIPKSNTQGVKTERQLLRGLVKNSLNSLGLNEILTYSFVSPKSVNMINTPENSIKRKVVKLLNPLGEENSVMRSTLVPNMLEVLSRNYNRNVDAAMAFELGRIFIKNENDDTLPNESENLVLGMYGKAYDFYTLKGSVEGLLERLGIKTQVAYLPESNHATFHPGRCANVVANGVFLGTIGELHPDVINNYGFNERVYIGDFDFEAIAQIANLEKRYAPLPKYPAISRDIALVVEQTVYVQEIEDIVKANGSDILEKVELFDVYQGKQVKEGCKSVAYSLTYRSKDKTLTDEEIAKVHEKILIELKEKLNATLRD